MNLQTTEVFKNLWESQKRINLLRGSSRSSKSFSLIQMVVLWLFTGRINEIYEPKGTFAIVRETFPALRNTIYKEMERYMRTLGVYGKVKHSLSQYTFRYQEREVIFFSVDDKSKLHGLETSFFWINEADAVEFEEFTQLLMRCRVCCWLDYNPYGEPFIKTELEEKRLPEREDVKLMLSTYKMNPYLPQPLVDEIEGLEYVDPDLYKVYALGQWANMKGVIFGNWKKVKHLPTEYDKRYFGLDFGYSNDPTALIEVREFQDYIFLHEWIYDTGLTYDDIHDKSGVPPGIVVYDSAEPKGGESLKRKGWRLKPSLKGRDSINSGINILKAKQIFITEESVNLDKERKNYKWKVDSLGDPVSPPKPIDRYNHAIDAARYAITKHSKRTFKILA